MLPFGQSFQIFAACGFRRCFEIDERRQRLIIDGNKLGSIARLRLAFGDDEGDMIADAADAIGEQNRHAWSEIPSVRPTIRA